MKKWTVSIKEQEILITSLDKTDQEALPYIFHLHLLDALQAERLVHALGKAIAQLRQKPQTIWQVE